MKRKIFAFVMLTAISLSVYAVEPGVTMANFEKLKTGMSYAEVVEILGKEGEKLSEAEFGETKTVMYQWKAAKKDKGAAGANMNAMFQNDKLVSKAQYGLK